MGEVVIVVLEEGKEGVAFVVFVEYFDSDSFW